ncbi:unnamed protein product, partial [Rotaria magnacalcarata]
MLIVILPYERNDTNLELQKPEGSIILAEIFE